MQETTINNFIKALSSKAPVPGGGGASALVGAVGVALCSMVANLTTGKKKYAEHQPDIDVMLSRTEQSISRLLLLIEKDAEVFEPLSAAYSIPKDDPSRDGVLESALVTACSVPMEILKELAGVVDVLEQLAVKGSRLAVSDIGVSATLCRAAMEGAIMNVYINTKLMNNRDCADCQNKEADGIMQDSVSRCERVYKLVAEELRGISCGN
jgi:formiminotetrahydrofolate cyclodeaminase